MSSLYELRIYVAKKDMLEPMMERWERHWKEIWEDHMKVLGHFVTFPEGAPEPTGMALLLEHEDRADVDRTFALVKGDPRMETAPGPGGEVLVERWERIFLYPAEFAESSGPSVTISPS